mmetsp:Transcript_67746/g.177652  ORF Transcript_67746/g.177652 Transcript_67746/m.177652 type:complete len:430 (-) Transcript_67746:550-1839(-)
MVLARVCSWVVLAFPFTSCSTWAAFTSTALTLPWKLWTAVSTSLMAPSSALRFISVSISEILLESAPTELSNWFALLASVSIAPLRRTRDMSTPSTLAVWCWSCSSMDVVFRITLFSTTLMSLASLLAALECRASSICASRASAWLSRGEPTPRFPPPDASSWSRLSSFSCVPMFTRVALTCWKVVFETRSSNLTSRSCCMSTIFWTAPATEALSSVASWRLTASKEVWLAPSFRRVLVLVSTSPWRTSRTSSSSASLACSHLVSVRMATLCCRSLTGSIAILQILTSVTTTLRVLSSCAHLPSDAVRSSSLSSRIFVMLDVTDDVSSRNPWLVALCSPSSPVRRSCSSGSSWAAPRRPPFISVMSSPASRSPVESWSTAAAWSEVVAFSSSTAFCACLKSRENGMSSSPSSRSLALIFSDFRLVASTF